MDNAKRWRVTCVTWQLVCLEIQVAVVYQTVLSM